MISWLIILLFLIILIPIAISSLLLAPPVPTPRKAVEEMLKLAGVRAGDMVYDLGSGDGRVIITAFQKFGAKSCGFELSILHYLVSVFLIYIKGLSQNVKMVYGNFYRHDLSSATVITIFGYPSKMSKVGKKLIKNLKPGSRVVSYAFSIKNLKLEKTIKPKNYAPIYLYKT